MNKTIIININGIVFHIEEDAYEILKNYMTDVKRHFLNSADSLEITTDIENRIAEMFTDLLLAENKQVIVEQDVYTVIEQMGRVEDFDEIYEDAKSSSAYTYSTSGRKLFRDPDDHLVSGVCAGIANYFNIAPIWIRLAFALSFFFAGSGLLLYIILWIVIPKATTRADRMAMKGEKLNLQGFKNNLEEELSSVRNHLNNLHQEARPVVYKMRDFISDFVDHLILFFRGAGKILIKIVGFAVLLACFGLAIFLVVLLVMVVGFHAMPHGDPFWNMIANEHNDTIYTAAFLTAFLPVVTIILAIIGALFNTRPIGRSVVTVLVAIWVCALIVLVCLSINIARNFRSTGIISQTIDLKATPDNVYYLKLNDIKYLTHEDSLRLNAEGHFKNVTIKNDNDENDESNSVSINIVRADVKHPVLIETTIAHGYDETDALINARNTNYVYLQQDSVIKFDEQLTRNAHAPWRDEHLDITLQLPLNAKVIIDQELNNRVNLDGVNVGDCKSINKQDKATSATFIMLDNGLQCKIDTPVIKLTPAQIDSARKVNSARTIEKLQGQVDSARRADSVDNQ